MAAKASGKEFIEHKANILENISKYFNNPDVSDMTLKVGNQEFAAHRFLLSTQSKVFMTMLMGENWKESEETLITLQESPDAEVAFSDFLKFFYTGNLTLTIDNVCGIHTLADKYDVDILKNDCVSFMKDVLTGIHGDALMAGIKWLQYAESVLQDVVELCYSAIRSHFVALTCKPTAENVHKSMFQQLSCEQVKKVLTVPEVGEELVSLNEHAVFSNVLYWGNRLFPHIRFYNIDLDHLQSLKDVVGEYYAQAYIVQAEMNNIARKAGKRRRLSQGSAEVRCPCDNTSTSTSQLHGCPHINPRLYLNLPYSNSVRGSAPSLIIVDPLDLSDLEGFARRLLYIEEGGDARKMWWKIKVSREYSGDPIYETYTVTPDSSHVGRKFTIAICCLQKEGTKLKKTEYVIRYTGEVAATGLIAMPFTLTSPFRFKGSWELDADKEIFGSILLHK